MAQDVVKYDDTLEGGGPKERDMIRAEARKYYDALSRILTISEDGVTVTMVKIHRIAKRAIRVW